jgi:hypothetical protein
MKMENLEKVYDEQISPLVLQIIEICQKNTMPFFLDFQYADNSTCKSSSPPKDNILIKYLEAIHQCVSDDGFNVDKFMFWVMKAARTTGHSSLILSQLGVDFIKPIIITSLAGKQRE